MSPAATAAPGIGARLRAELAPTPGRWREAAIVALGPSLAVLVSLTVSLPGFIAPTVAYFALQRITVSSWHNLPRRLAYIAAAGFVLVPFGGFLLQQPWFLLPAFFVAVSGTLYFLPLPRRPVEGSSILFVLSVFTYESLFAPTAMATSARDVAVEAALGVLAATVVAETFRFVGPRSRLAESLASSFARNRERFRAAIDRYRASATATPPTEVEATSTLSSHLQLLDQVRQEGVSHDEERTLVALTTAAERIESYVSTIDDLSRQDVGRTYRRLLDGEIAPLAMAIDRSLAAYEETSRQRGARSADAVPPSPDPAWPDVTGLARTLEARQLDLRRAGLLAIDVAEATNTNTCVRMLAGLGDVLHTPPEELAQIAAGEPAATAAPAPRRWPRPPQLRPFDLRYALHGGLGTTLCLIVGVATNLPQLSTILFNPILVAQTSYGATVRRAGLRMLGVILGALLGLAAIAAVTPNTMDVTVYVVLCFAVAAACQYVSLGTPGSWYASFQVAISFFVVTYALAPSTDVEMALWRAWGTALGTALLFAVYGIVAPDYAGRQLVARFGDLLRSTLEFLPRPGAPVHTLEEQIERRLEVGSAVADALRLADEARLERRQGIDAGAALEAVGLAMRLAYRSGLVARGRTIAPPPALAQPLAALLDDLEGALRDWVAILLAMVEARDTMARPGALSHHRARERAASALERPRPDVAGRMHALVAHLEQTRFAALGDLPPRVSGELLAALEHYRRMGDLLPRLDRALVCALLPGHALAETEDGEPEPPERARGLAA